MKIRVEFVLLLGMLLGVSCGSDSEEPTPVPAERVALAAPAPVVSDLTTDACTVSWASVDGAASYNYTVDGRQGYVEGLAVRITGLAADTEYEIKVQAVPSDTAARDVSAWGSATFRTSAPAAEKEYVLVWSDEFDGDALDESCWTYEEGGNANQEKQYYTGRSENLRVENGELVIEARREPYYGYEYTSGRINSKGKVTCRYGYVEARIWLPSGCGTWPAFWMMGSEGGWPRCGEIDIMEHIGSDPGMISHALHTTAANGSKGNNWNFLVTGLDVEGSWHTYAIAWEEKADSGDDLIAFYVDGVKSTTVYAPHGIEDQTRWPFTSEFYVILNLAMGGMMGGEIDDTIFDEPVVMKVDYVRIYRKQ